MMERIETLLAQSMFVLTTVFLALLAVIIQYLQSDYALERTPSLPLLIQLLGWLWPLFWVERLAFLVLCRETTKRSVWFALWIGLFPPLRLASRRCSVPHLIWLRNGWCDSGEETFKRLEKKFLYTILGISTFMLPFWIYEIVLPARLAEDFFLYHFINLGNALIWGVFVIEFTVMLSLSPKPLKYLAKHWLELMIIILPAFALVRFLYAQSYFALLQVAKFQKMVFGIVTKFQRLLNIYRARTFLNRTVHMLIIFKLLKHWHLRRDPEAYLDGLREKLEEKQQEVTELQEEIAEIEALITERAREESEAGRSK